MVTLRPFLGPVVGPLIGTVLPVLLITLPAAPARAADINDGIETDRIARQIAPGIRLESYDRLHADRWLRIDELLVDLAAPGLRAEYLGGPGTLAQAVARHPAGRGRRVVAAVNGDFFDIRRTGAPLGPGVADGRLLHSPSPGAGTAVGFGPGPVGRVLSLALAGTVTLPGSAPLPLAGFNSARPPAEGITAYTADWAGSGAALPPGAGAEADVQDGVVTAVRQPGRGTEPSAGTTLLAGRGAAAAQLAALSPGDRVGITAGPAAGSGPLPTAAIGGRERLVVHGVPQNHDRSRNNIAAPRTAVGFSRDGRYLRILTVDGRQRDSGGMTLTALGRLLHERGAHNALNLDGGGSSTLLAGRSGDTLLSLENSPSDGRPRTIPNGLVLTVAAGSGRTAGHRVEAPAGSTRVFPGLTRTLTAVGYDDMYAPDTAGGPDWWTTPGSAGWVGPDGVFHAVRPGGASVHAGRAPADGTIRLDVLGALTRIRPVPARIGLADRAEQGTFRLAGFDAQGAAAPVEGRDVRWQYDRSRWQVADDGRGGFTLTARVPRATGVLKATVPATGATAELAVGVGSVERQVTGFDEADRWTGSGAGPADGHRGTGLRLSAGGAGDSARPPKPLPLPDPVRSLRLWVRGDGSGIRPVLRLIDADWAELALRGPAVDWSGWRRITLPVPAAAERPLTLTGLTASGGTRTGKLVLDTLTATGPDLGPAPAVPSAEPDPRPATAAEVRARSWRFGVLPAGLPEADRRRALAALRAGTPDFILTQGTATGTGPGAGADGLRPVPGTASFRHRGVRFLPLDTGRRTLQGGGLARLRALRAGLTEAARDRDTGALVLVQPYGGADRVDRKEAVLWTRWLAEFRRTTGKGTAVITLNSPQPGSTRSEGVLSHAVGSSGWALVGADAFDRPTPAAPGGSTPAPAARPWLAVHAPPTAAAE
ncbi:phosphodiester glycosidase family protein [Streptomyces sp. NPDC002054]|uniref:phosphodiester glycosidase family protein n=1 Tax=Streptomyces sp. NPDC002054 TaxID=3154663 RepID=UPI003322B7B4